eukprot:COSAG01_NODE_1861_length_9039_cov_6.964094_3_plen_138_part_00
MAVRVTGQWSWRGPMSPRGGRRVTLQGAPRKRGWRGGTRVCRELSLELCSAHCSMQWARVATGYSCSTKCDGLGAPVNFTCRNWATGVSSPCHFQLASIMRFPSYYEISRFCPVCVISAEISDLALDNEAIFLMYLL